VCILTRMVHINLLVLHAIDNTRQRIKRHIQNNGFENYKSEHMFRIYFSTYNCLITWASCINSQSTNHFVGKYSFGLQQ
jgi:hypothetical protein